MDSKYELLKRWFRLKVGLHMKNRHPTIREGEVWWCNFGENIGVEMNGKHELFLRPVVILKVYSKWSFLGLPLTSQLRHVGTWYTHFFFQQKGQVCVLSQGKAMSISRLYKRKGRIDEMDFERIRSDYIKLHDLELKNNSNE